MKILVVHEIDYYESPLFEFHEFSEGFARAGHDVSVLDIRENRIFGDSKREKLRAKLFGRVFDIGVKLHSPRVPISNNIFRPYAVAQHFLILLRIFVTDRPDIVFSYSVPTSGPTLALFGRIFNVPVVHRAIDVSHKLRPGIYAPIVRVAEKLTFKFSTCVSTHNRALADYARANGAELKNVSIQYPPVDLSLFGKVTELSSTNENSLVFVGTLHDFSGLETVIKQSKNYRNEPGWTLKVVGDGPQREFLQNLVRDLGLSKKILFTGWVDYKNLSNVLADSNIAIVPFRRSLLTDCALPQKTIQYLAAGLPVISTRLAGSVSELSGFGQVHFVDGPGEILEYALKTEINNPSSNRIELESKFGYDIALSQMLSLLSTHSNGAQRKSSDERGG